MNKGEMREAIFNRKGKTITLQIDLDLDEDQTLPKTHGKYYVLSEAEYKKMSQEIAELSAQLENLLDPTVPQGNYER
jgi:hypothetical protein